jgi:hypothetical protein
VKSILSFCFLLFVVNAMAQKVRPLLHLAAGQTYYLQSTATSVAAQVVSGTENRVNTTIFFTISFKVIGQTDSCYSLEARYLSLGMTIRLADTTLEMNSKTDSKPDTPSAIMVKIVNKPFGIKMTQGGKVKLIEGLDRLISAAFSDFQPKDSLKKKKVLDQFVQAFGEGTIKGILQMGTGVFPARLVIKNDQWEQNAVISSPALAHVHTVYHLIDLTPAFYFIHGEGLIAAGKDINPGELNGIPMRYELNGSLLTEIKIDRNTGWISELKLKQLIEENIEMPDNPQTPAGMTIPMMFTTDMTISDAP